VEPADLLGALLEELESRAVLLLAEHGVEPEALLSGLDEEHGPGAEKPEIVTHSAEIRLVLGDATDQARAIDRGREVGTEHLLFALVGLPGDVSQRLEQAGLRRDDLIESMARQVQEELAPIPMAPEIPALELAPPGEAADLGRILDASSNRAREGLRVVEDYVRFALDDPMLTRRLKDCRHRLSEAIRGLEAEGRLIGSRDTPGDVGTHIMTASEQARENPRAVLAANFKRTGEALRSLEEYGKLENVWLAGRFEVLRYDVYTLEKLVMTAVASRQALDDARLYVLVGGLPTLGDLTWVVGEALAGGAQVIQLREKGLSDREVLSRAREVRLLTIQARARFILNDRPDLARLAGADGVHLGQDDVLPRDARRVVGPSALLGVSTHGREQVERAVLDGASYLGVGPVFPSGTKDFSALAGLEFVRQAAETSTLPWFAIGGIDESNLDAVLEAGARRVAVSGAVVRAERPKLAARAVRRRLDELAGE
jgi:thiamine-phosphate pyrophosphorylase